MKRILLLFVALMTATFARSQDITGDWQER